jgi:threonine synthase
MTPFSAALRCSACNFRHAIDRLFNLCPQCSSPLLVEYDLAAGWSPPIKGPDSMWRYADVLPPRDEIISLGEGMTPLLQSRTIGPAMGLEQLYFKDESTNPTRSFKSRGMSAAVTMARRFGAPALAAPTAGNAGCALAAYGARAGLPVFVAMPADTPGSIIDECRDFGAEVALVPGVITDAARVVQQHVREHGAFDLSTLKEPYRIEGKKTMAYELVEQLGRVPDVVLYPTGGGTGLIGMWKAFGEMERLGWIGPERPRMYSVQSDGCAPIVRAFDSGQETAPEWDNPHTGAWGLRVPRAIGDRLMLRALRGSGGGGVAVPEDRIEPAASEVRTAEGIDAGPEGGAALLALRQLVAARAIHSADVVVIFNTGGNKYRPGTSSSGM